MCLNGIAIYSSKINTLDARKSLLIAFLAISDQCATFFFDIFFHKLAAGVHFRWPKITFDRISRHFRSIRMFFLQNGRRPFWIPKITFDRISRHFRSIRNFFCLIFFSKWPLHQIWNGSAHFWLRYGVHKLFNHIFTILLFFPVMLLIVMIS